MITPVSKAFKTVLLTPPYNSLGVQVAPDVQLDLQAVAWRAFARGSMGDDGVQRAKVFVDDVTTNRFNLAVRPRESKVSGIMMTGYDVEVTQGEGKTQAAVMSGAFFMAHDVEGRVINAEANANYNDIPAAFVLSRGLLLERTVGQDWVADRVNTLPVIPTVPRRYLALTVAG